MSFLVLLVVLLLEKLTALRVRVQDDRLWLKALAKTQGQSPWLTLAFVVALPTVMLALVVGLAESFWYGALAFPLHVWALLYSLGRGDVRVELGPSVDALRRTDEQGAIYAAERDLGLTSAEPVETLLQQHLLWRAYEGFFAVIFWYALLGPIVALAYRLLDLTERYAEGGSALLAKQLRHGLDWLPSRFFVLSAALVGNFSAVSRVVLPELLNWSMSIPRFVSEAARAAVEQDLTASVDDFATLWLLLVRAAVLWYAGFALAVVLL